MERLDQREKVRVRGSLRTPNSHARMSSPTIPGPQVGWVVVIEEWSLGEKNKHGVEGGAGPLTMGLALM